jgi:hypothetical protein
MAAGHDQGVHMWALMASIDAGEQDWMNGIELQGRLGQRYG